MSSSVSICRDSGAGKGMMARAIHDASPRASGAFVTVNCPSLSAELLESEMFGHVKGSFTGASQNTVGRVSHADGGTGARIRTSHTSSERRADL